MMGDEGDFWRDVRNARKERRAELGVECPECKRLQPKRNATVLLPGQRCRVDGYRDPRKIREVKER
jgi:hypothetical protein